MGQTGLEDAINRLIHESGASSEEIISTLEIMLMSYKEQAVADEE